MRMRWSSDSGNEEIELNLSAADMELVDKYRGAKSANAFMRALIRPSSWQNFPSTTVTATEPES